MSFKRNLVTGLAAIVLGLSMKCGDPNTENYTNTKQDKKYEMSVSYNKAPKVNITFPNADGMSCLRGSYCISGPNTEFTATIYDPDHDKIIRKKWSHYNPGEEHEFDFSTPNSKKTQVYSHINSTLGYKTIRFCATDSNHAKRCKDRVINVINNPPVADAGNDWGTYVNVPILFDASASSDIDGYIKSCSWVWGDGQTYTEINISAPDGNFDCKVNHTYSNSNLYTITLTVTDNGDSTDQDTCQAAISP